VRAAGLTDDGYTEVEYITFNGSNYIDMDVGAVGNTKVTVDYQYATVGNDLFLFGSQISNAANWHQMRFGMYTSGYQYMRGSASSNSGGGSLFTSAANTDRHTVVANNNTVQVDALPVQSFTAANPTTNYNLYLGALNASGARLFYQGKVYKAAIDKDTATDDRNFVPVRCGLSTCSGTTNTGSPATYAEYGLYDTLNNKFYHGAGSALSGAAVPPIITDITPDSGSWQGGDDVVITGTGFTSNSSATFGDKIVGCETDSDFQLTCTTPQHTVGTVDVMVRTESGETGTLADGFTFTPNPPPIQPSADQHYFAANTSGQTLTISGDFSDVPAGFEQVEYLAFNGTQYIDMGVGAVGSTIVTVDYQFNSISSGVVVFVFGSQINNSANWQSMRFGFDGSITGYNFQRGSASAAVGATIFGSAVNVNRHTVIVDNNTAQVDDLTPISLVNPASPTVSYNMYLGALNAGGAVRQFSGRIYEASVDKAGTADDRHFVPVKCSQSGGCNNAVNTGSTTIAEGTYGMFDTLHQVFYRAGAGTLGGGGAMSTVTGVKVDGAALGVGNYTVVSDSQLAVEVPSHGVTSSPVAVEVTSVVWGTVTLSGADGLNFVEITSPSPAVGSAGDVVTFSGSGFSAFTAPEVDITFAGASGSDITIVNDNTITVKVPMNPVVGSFGAVDVVLTLGSESLTFVDGFAYESFLKIGVDKPILNMSGSPGQLISDHVTINVKTDNPTGYNLTIETDDIALTCTDDETQKITALPEVAGTMQDNKWGYAVDNEVTPTTPSSWTGLTVAGASLKNTTTPQADPTSGEDTRVWFGTRADYTLSACSYTGSVTFTAVANV
jgi:hypothetical protein